jgi:galactose mutarotase-like enzyme
LHPYLNVAGGATLKIGGQTIDFGAGEFGPLVVRRADPIVLERSIGRVIIRPSENCEWLVVWSDQSSYYLCIEPVYGGAPGSFYTPEGHTLGSLETMRCSVVFQFIPA